MDKSKATVTSGADDDDDRFVASDARLVIKKELTSVLNNVKTYNVQEIPHTTAELSQRIRSALEKLNYVGYKYGIHVQLSESRGQGVFMHACTVADEARGDDVVVVQHETPKVLASVVVFAAFYQY